MTDGPVREPDDALETLQAFRVAFESLRKRPLEGEEWNLLVRFLL